MTTLPKAYQPRNVEKKWYRAWMEKEAFHADPASAKETYSVVIPPPNVTGILTMGHVLNNTIQDILCRRARMQGKEVLWLPGTDHAGIATQTKVEKKLLEEEKQTRHDVGREAFLEHVWDWKEKHGNIIIEQLKRLGCSCDWSREVFTMDAQYSRAVAQAFVDLFEEGFIYRGKRMVNWCPASLTALSDEEVIMKPSQSKLYVMQYEVAEEPGTYLEIATTRPETLMGDTAVAVHPDDERYQRYIGKHCWRPFPKEKIPIIADEQIDLEFGTGVLKVTPAHDKADFEIGQRHHLPAIDVFHPDATLNALAGEEFVGLDRFAARKKAVQKLQEMGQLVRVEEYENNIGYSERAHVPIEPRISRQWFLRYPKVKEATAAVEKGEITFRPERWAKTYRHWMENIEDWCISRQLWWGHRIPVWYQKEHYEALQSSSLEASHTKDTLYVGVEPPQDGENWVQDPDVLDTWFSSWLWPFATMEEEERSTFYPTTDLVTGPDILFFWVARMIMAGYRFTGQKPFSHVFFTSMIRDLQGRKMSKSLGNSPDPLDLMEKYGADGLRFGMMRIAPTGTDVRFDEQQIEEGRNFANKIWNAARYRSGAGQTTALRESLDPEELSIFDIAILAKLDAAQEKVDQGFANYKFNDIAHALYEFFWSEYCDKYLEVVKRDFFEEADPGRRNTTLSVMDKVLERFLLLLHPYMPHITEELWEKLGYGESHPEEFLLLTTLPAHSLLPSLEKSRIQRDQDRAQGVYETAHKLRNLKAEYHLAANKSVRFILHPNDDWVKEVLSSLSLLVGAKEVDCDLTYRPEKGTPGAVTPLGKFYMPLEGLIDIDAERNRLQKELEKIEKEMQKVDAKLTNEHFMAKAPQAIIQENKDRKSHWEEKQTQLEEMLKNL